MKKEHVINEGYLKKEKSHQGASFTFKNRFLRLLWIIIWRVFCSYTPVFFHKWRIFFINIFGANISYDSFVYPSVKIWAPWNLNMEESSTLGPNVICYNIARVTLKYKSVVSQAAYLCTGTHDYTDPLFKLYALPIKIGAEAWVCANSFVGPGVTIADGAVLGACSVTFKNIEAWKVYAGNPSVFIKDRIINQ